jgi:hypothetical protein
VMAWRGSGGTNGPAVLGHTSGQPLVTSWKSRASTARAVFIPPYLKGMISEGVELSWPSGKKLAQAFPVCSPVRFVI